MKKQVRRSDRLGKLITILGYLILFWLQKQERPKDVGRLHRFKATPKDLFPSTSIHQLVDATIGFNFMSFMEIYSEYHQIIMHLKDEEKISFTIEEGTFWYTRIPFGLKK